MVIEQVITGTESFLSTHGVDVAGIALAGSRAKHAEHRESDFDLIVLSRTPRNLHIEDICLDGNKVQLFLIPLNVVDRFLLLNVIAGNGIMASMFETLQVRSGEDLFDRIRANLTTNRRAHMKIERETANRNLLRLRYRVSMLIKDLSNSSTTEERTHIAAELLKVIGHFLLAKKGVPVRQAGKHLQKELARIYTEEEAQALTKIYRHAVANTDYTAFIEYCRMAALNGAVPRYGSSSVSRYDMKRDLGYNVVFINSYSIKLVRLIHECTKEHRPLIVLNQHRDLLHLGIYFIVDVKEMSTVSKAIEAAQLRPDELGCMTLNYQLDQLLLSYFTQYNHNGLLADLSAYSMECDLDRDLVMNSVFDWILNAGITIFSRDEFVRYVRICQEQYHRSMAHEPDRLDLERSAMQARQMDKRLELLSGASVTEKYHDAIKEWAPADITDAAWRRRILDAYSQESLPTIHHSIFERNSPFGKFHSVFEAVFDATLLRYNDRGLIYLMLHQCLEEGGSHVPDDGLLKNA